MNCLMGMSRKPVGEKLHFHVGIKTHFDVDIYNRHETLIKCYDEYKALVLFRTVWTGM